MIAGRRSAFSFEPPAEIRSPKVHQLHRYWSRLRGDRIAPRWMEVDPGELRQILSFIVVCDFRRDPFDIHFRIVGTAVVEAYGEDFRDRNLRDLEATGGHELWCRIYRRIIAEARPGYGRYFLAQDSGSMLCADTGIFPLSSDGRTVDRTVEIEDWSDALRQAPRILMHHAWQYEEL
jgi:hypothetical protein